MTAPRLESEDVLLQAASLAFALIRFEEGAAHPFRGATPPDMLQLGEGAYLLTPSWRHIPRADVPAFLAGLPSPALLSPTTTRGVVALTLLGELSGDRAAWARKTLANQRAGIENLFRQLELGDDAFVLLEFDEERHLVPLAVLRTWSDRFAVQVKWSIGPLEDDADASARMHLHRSDGHRSSGASCPIRSPR